MSATRSDAVVSLISWVRLINVTDKTPSLVRFDKLCFPAGRASGHRGPELPRRLRRARAPLRLRFDGVPARGQRRVPYVNMGVLSTSAQTGLFDM